MEECLVMVFGLALGFELLGAPGSDPSDVAVLFPPSELLIEGCSRLVKTTGSRQPVGRSVQFQPLHLPISPNENDLNARTDDQRRVAPPLSEPLKTWSPRHGDSHDVVGLYFLH